MAKRDIVLNIKAKTDTGQINQQINLVINQINRVSRATKATGSSFANITGGNVAARAISQTAGFLKQMSGEIVHLGIESVKLAANFQDTTNALAVFTGSAASARKELAEVDKLAARTAGLSLESAEQGYQRLRALGFQAEQTRKLVAGLGNQKILSGADNAAVDRVIVNLTQIRASSKDASRDIKEMIKAIPSLSGVFEDAFGTANTSKLRSFLQQDPKKFFDTLATGLANAERAEGGLNDATGKLTDSFIQAGREFGKPILEPFTNSIKTATELVENNRDSFRVWGQYVGDVISGATILMKRFNDEEEKRRKEKGAQTPSAPSLLQRALGKSDEEYSDLFTYGTFGLAGGLIGASKREGETARNEQNQKKGVAGYIKDLAKGLSATQKIQKREEARELEEAKQRELEILKDSADEGAAILKNRYERE